MNTTRLCVVDDHAIFREALVSKLNSMPTYEVVAELDNGADAIDAVAHLDPDVMLLDISLKGMNGIDALRLMRAQHLACKVVMLSMHSSRSIITRAMTMGADAYVLKDEGINELLAALDEVLAGRRFVSPGANVGVSVMDPPGDQDTHTDLTAREEEIVGMIAQGMSSKSIAIALKLSAKTIDAHRVNVYRKLGISNTADLTRYAVRNGIISL